jgi:hypothetical protein
MEKIETLIKNFGISLTMKESKWALSVEKGNEASASEKTEIISLKPEIIAYLLEKGNRERSEKETKINEIRNNAKIIGFWKSNEIGSGVRNEGFIYDVIIGNDRIAEEAMTRRKDDDERLASAVKMEAINTNMSFAQNERRTRGTLNAEETAMLIAKVGTLKSPIYPRMIDWSSENDGSESEAYLEAFTDAKKNKIKEV